MSQVEVDKIIPQSGTTLTIGDNGDTITIASGATLSGDLNADNLTSGTVPDARITGTYTGITGLDLTDNSKIRLGTGNDLQIYHDGSHSFIADEGTGNLTIKSNGTGIELQKGDSEFLARFKTDNAVELYYDNSKKFETTSTGATVTTTLSGANDLNLQTSDANEKITLDMSGTQRFNVNGSEKMRLTTTGLGIGSSTPTQKLFSAVDSTLPIPTSASMGSSTSGVANGIGIHNTNNSSQYSGLTLETKTTNASRWLIANEWKSNFNGDLVFRSRIDGSSSSEILRLKSDGKVGIGTTSPSTNLDISSGGDATINLKASGQSNGLQLSQLTSDGGSSISATNNNYLKFSTNATERMRITSAGVVGIGTSSPHSISNLHVADTYANEPMIRIETSDGGNKRLDLYVSGGHGYITATQSAQDLNFATRTNLIFKTNTSSERMRIDSSGNLLVAKTSTTRVASGAEIRPTGFGRFTRDQANPLELVRTTNDGEAIKFYKDNTNVGNISVTASSTSYNTSSDYRLKENVDYTFDATTRLKQLKPARFNFIADADTTVDGFIAHEVSSIVPEAISGEKDAVNEDGSINPQGIDQSKLVPLLVKTIQELEARITTLENA